MGGSHFSLQLGRLAIYATATPWAACSRPPVVLESGHLRAAVEIDSSLSRRAALRGGEGGYGGGRERGRGEGE